MTREEFEKVVAGGLISYCGDTFKCCGYAEPKTVESLAKIIKEKTGFNMPKNLGDEIVILLDKDYIPLFFRDTDIIRDSHFQVVGDIEHDR